MTADIYLAQLQEDRKQPMLQLIEEIKNNIPEGFSMSFDKHFVHFTVPHSIYPDGYHCNPKQSLPFISLANQKNFIALYHMGIYADPDLLQWFQSNYALQVPTKLDMGKSCIRFKKMEHIPFSLIKELVKKMSVQEWISLYEENLRNYRSTKQ